ncbi:MAG: NAD(P)/FAD-dependent oxidoreductase [Chloroflexi bacterium]|nr:NAD(P)/FAD-dependent oxidoreductase [Chloroflexota bacterium]
MEKHDVVVVGGGHNGLTVAAYLAKAGVDVCVLERQDKVGGAAVTRELTVPGFKHDLGSVQHLLVLANPITYRDELGLLSKYGLKYIPIDPLVSVLFPDDRALTIYRDAAKTRASIAQFSERDADAYAKFVDYLGKISQVAAIATFSPPIPFGRMVSVLDQSEGGQEYLRVIHSSAIDILEEWFESDYVKAALARIICEQLIAPSEKGTGIGIFAYGLYHRGWSVPQGGSGALSEALAACIKDKGGTVKVSSPVKTIKVENGEAKAVVLENGEEIAATKAIISNLNVKQLLLQMVAAEALPPGFTDKVKRIKQSSFAPLHQALALNEAPKFKGGGDLDKTVMILFSDVMDKYLRVHEDLLHGIPRTDLPTIAVATLVDPTRAPAGKHTLYLYFYEPYNLKDGGPQGWDKIKQQVADGILETLRAHTTNMGPENILGRWAFSPLDFERYNPAFISGDFLHIGMFVTQMFGNRPIPGWAQYRTPVKRLYMCGASTHPGGGVSCGGRAAVQVIMEDLGIDFRKVVAK